MSLLNLPKEEVKAEIEKWGKKQRDIEDRHRMSERSRQTDTEATKVILLTAIKKMDLLQFQING